MTGQPDLITTSLKMLASLTIILGLLLTVFYVARKFFRKYPGGSKESLVRILGNTYVGVKKSISLVRVPGAVLVLGVTNENINLLCKIDDVETIEELKRRGNEGSASYLFGSTSKDIDRIKDKRK